MRIIPEERFQNQAPARLWMVAVNFRPKRKEFIVSISDGIYFIGFFGRTLSLHARLESEFRGALAALEWLKHDKKTPAEIIFSVQAFTVFMGEEPCPEELKPSLDRLRRCYITSADSVRIDRERHALVSEERRLAA